MTAVDIEMGAATHAGRVRDVNEDAYLARDGVAMVADGMGGHACGDEASRHVVQAFATGLRRSPLGPDSIHEALAAANAEIVAASGADPQKAGMGTTVAGIALVEYAGTPHWLVFNVGDSRVYRVVDDIATQLTVDHSEVAELVSTGRITAEQAATHPLRHVVTRSLGNDPMPAADVWLFPPVASGETFLVCSDGLTNELSTDEITGIITASRGPRDAAAELVARAVEAGGRDNVTAVVLSSATVAEDELDVATVPRGGSALR